LVKTVYIFVVKCYVLQTYVSFPRNFVGLFSKNRMVSKMLPVK